MTYMSVCTVPGLHIQKSFHSRTLTDYSLLYEIHDFREKFLVAIFYFTVYTKYETNPNYLYNTEIALLY